MVDQQCATSWMSEHLVQHRKATLIGLPFGKTLHWAARFGMNDIHIFAAAIKKKYNWKHPRRSEFSSSSLSSLKLQRTMSIHGLKRSHTHLAWDNRWVWDILCYPSFPCSSIVLTFDKYTACDNDKIWGDSLFLVP